MEVSDGFQGSLQGRNASRCPVATQAEAVTGAIALTLALVLGLTIGIAIGAVVGSVLQRRPLGICAINRDTVSRRYLLTLRPDPLASLSRQWSQSENPQLSKLYSLLNLDVAALIEAEQARRASGRDPAIERSDWSQGAAGRRIISRWTPCGINTLWTRQVGVELRVIMDCSLSAGTCATSARLHARC